MGQPHSFFIAEIGDVASGHTLRLDGRALPYRPLSFDGEMRAEFTHYPGSPIATVQVLGPKENKTTIKGMWKDRFIKTSSDLGIPIVGQTGMAHYDGMLVSNVVDLVKVTDGFRRRGQLLEVSWGEFVRQGIMTKFHFDILRDEDIEWEMEFEWMSQGEDELPIIFSATGGFLDIINSLINAVNGLVEAVNELKDEIAAIESWVNAVNNLVDTIQEVAASLADLAQQVSELVVAPAAVIGNMVSACQTIVDSCKDLVETFESLPSRVVRAVGVDPNSETQGETLSAERVIRKSKRAARTVRDAAIQRQLELLIKSQGQSRPLAVVTAKAGQDLRTISQRYYGTPNEWIRLMSYNRLGSSKLLAGDVVIVPKLGDLNAYNTVGQTASTGA